MKIIVITLFPDLFIPFFTASILGRAKNKGLVDYELINLREFGEGKHQVVDDRPFGGGAGMILKAPVLALAWGKALKYLPAGEKPYTVLMSASGKVFQQEKAQKFAKNLKSLIIISGHYEGVDQRFIDKYVDEEISIGDFVLTGGEIPALAVIDSIVRVIPDVLEKPEAIQNESFSLFHSEPDFCFPLLEYPQYTRPKVFLGKKVPPILLLGNHQAIKNWRLQQSLAKTKKVRPDLLKKPIQKD